MGKIKVIETSLKDAYIIEPAVFGDHRGFFTESYSRADFVEVGLSYDFIQDNHSFSAQAGIIRGLHFQIGDKAQTKLVRAVTGVLLDVIVDLRKGSPTYGQWESFILSESNHRQLLVPKGFAHGFMTLSDNVNFLYKCDEYYAPEADSGITFNDETLNINWPFPLDKAVTSEKDAKQQTFLEYDKRSDAFVYGQI